MILVFAKTPVPGEVKTRLIADLGAEAATRLYCRLLHRTLDTACSDVGLPVQLQLLGASDHPDIAVLLQKYSLTVKPQRGGDLGERMYLAAEAALATEPMVILIGTDCPLISTEYLHAAIDALAAGSEAVLGPAEDGGYVLLGLRRNHMQLFTGIDWSTDRVMDQTMARIEQLGWSYHLLPMLWDVDRVEDVQRLQQLGIMLEQIP